MKESKGKNDALLVIIILAVAIAAYILLQVIGNQKGIKVKISMNGEEYKTVSLISDELITLEGENGTKNVIKIENGYAKMMEANCPDHYCIHQGAISKHNEVIVCLPNKVIVEVVDSKNSDSINEIDGIAN